jgi:hypothetical protein
MPVMLFFLRTAMIRFRFLFVAVLFIPLSSGFVIPSNNSAKPWLSVVRRLATLDDTTTHGVAATDALLETMSSSASPAASAQQWADMFGLGESERAFYALFDGIRKEIPIGLRGKPFVLRENQIKDAVGVSFGGFFNFEDLEKAVNDDFLDAGRGTTDNRKGWKVSIQGMWNWFL